MLAVMVDPCYWISRTGAGLVMSDTLPLSFQATGPFLHIGIVGGMTLLAWPLASVIYRTHSTGNPPPGSPPLPTAGCSVSCTPPRGTGSRVVHREQWCSRDD